jgi:hypothetical protein
MSASGKKATTLLWRKCCLDKWYKTLWHSSIAGEVGRKAHKVEYHCHLLRDASSTTVELGGGNALQRGGIIYAQRYNTMKSVFDVQGIYPFTSRAIEGCLVPQVSRLYGRKLREEGLGHGLLKNAKGFILPQRCEFDMHWRLLEATLLVSGKNIGYGGTCFLS